MAAKASGFVVLLALLSTSPFGVAASASNPTVIARPLTTSDLPSGFKDISVALVARPCSEPHLPKVRSRQIAIGLQSSSLTIVEALTLTNKSRAAYEGLVVHYAACRSMHFMQRGMRATGSGGRLQFAQVGDVSQAFAFELKINGFRVNEDLIVFQKSLTCGVLEFLSRSPLDTKAVELVASIAASKAFSSIS